ncbi:hypothetical protein SCLCIDRAFT_735598 [Scleroderma citrinum Foug A]|uniref:Uncharacterized protein n=1 Tax=Scleroderma citrinum Foug A TaxID=1036808 RepID=A0A0C3DSR2_9AGAM|nr:hypothetical protein SCLCIDRAFT_735598 [Scleroderma citrinum Foug A]
MGQVRGITLFVAIWRSLPESKTCDCRHLRPGAPHCRSPSLYPRRSQATRPARLCRLNNRMGHKEYASSGFSRRQL